MGILHLNLCIGHSMGKIFWKSVKDHLKSAGKQNIGGCEGNSTFDIHGKQN